MRRQLKRKASKIRTEKAKRHSLGAMARAAGAEVCVRKSYASICRVDGG